MSLGRRLRVVFQGAIDPDDASGIPDDGATTARGTLPLVEFVAYADDCILSGRVRLAADRLTDMLNEYDEILLVDVMVERLDGQGATEVREVLVHRDELLIVHATGPRGSQARRQRTRQHPLAMKLGPYEVRGYLHALPGADPLLAIRRRKVMVPLTDAWIEFNNGGTHHRRRSSGLVVNRDQIRVLAHAQFEEVDMPDFQAHSEGGPLVKDFTGNIRIDSPTT